MALANPFWLGRVFRESNTDGDGGGQSRPSPAEVNARLNRDRLSRIEAVGRVADGRRAAELHDTEGEQITGRFAAGEFDNSPEAKERQAAQEDELARQALDEQRERDAEYERLEQDRARGLQAEGGEESAAGGESPAAGEDGGTGAAESDERVVDGVRYYLTIVNGQQRWLTLKELRTHASASATAEETLQRAQEALRSAAHAELSPKEAPVEVSQKDLENIILSASMGDEEAVRKLASVVSSRAPSVDPDEVSRLVAQRLATQREVDRAEAAVADVLGNEILAPVFKQRLGEIARSKPQMKIADAYKAVGEQMRRDFGAMIKTQPTQRTAPQTPVDKRDRKRTIVNPPQGAGRQPRREEDDREVPMSEQIDAIARARGQARAHRVRRS